MKMYPDNPIRRLQNNPIPSLDFADATNPMLQPLLQIDRFGFDCTPQMAAIKLRESFASVPAPHLIQDVAHAKSWITEQLITYIDGMLPYWLRAPKFKLDHINELRYAARIVATARLLIAMLNKEVALANAWANVCTDLINFRKENLTPSALRTEGEQLLAGRLDTALANIAQQINENTQNLDCLL